MAGAEAITEGSTADYIPELAHVPKDLIALTVQATSGKAISVANIPEHPATTLQSVSKLIPLIGLLEEFGADRVFSWVNVEPSGSDFASIARLAQFGPRPSNPMLNAGAITLCSHIPGEAEDKFRWLDKWVAHLFNKKLSINSTVLASEKRTGDNNRAIAYLLQSTGSLNASVKETLDLYLTLCSYEAKPQDLIHLPFLLANGGVNVDGERILSDDTVKCTLAIMGTCGLYNESGSHMVKTGMPAKSGVSGYILAVVPGKAGIVVLSPRVTKKGTSVRGEWILEQLSQQLGWHFALQ